MVNIKLQIVNKMAGDEQSKLEFTTILSRIPRKFDIIHTKWIEEKLFEAKFRTQIPRENDDYNGLCDEWVDLFSGVTQTTWVKKISNTGPKIRFRKQYQCWTHPGKVQKELLFDARRCKGTIDIKVLTDNPQTRRKNKHIKIGLNVVVKINFIHLHPVDYAKPYAFFVHCCEPQAEPPNQPVKPNDNLPKLIANILEKGRQTIPKTPLPTPPDKKHPNMITINGTLSPNIEQKLDCPEQLLHVHNLDHLNMIQLNQVVPLQGVDSIKLVSSQPQLTQVVVNGQLDMTEPLLMCQPTLMFDPSQVIPVSSHSLQQHFVQVQSHNLTHNQSNF